MADAAPPAPPRWRRLLARRRTRVLLALVVLLIGVRIALPAVLRRVVVAQADQALVGRVELDDVDLSLSTGGITLHGLRVYAEEAPPPGTAAREATTSTSATARADAGAPAARDPAPAETSAVEPNPAATPTATAAPSASGPSAATSGAASPASSAATDVSAARAADAAPTPPAARASPSPAPEAGTGPAGSAPVLSAKHLIVDIGYRALFRRIVEIERIELDDVAVSLDRAKDGTLVLPAAAPATEPTPEPSPGGPGWGVLIRSVALHEGHIGFRDFAIGDPPQRVDVTLPTLDASELALLITQRGLQPGAVSLDAGIRGGTLHLDAKIESADAGPAYESHVVLTNVPIADSRLYIPDVGWSGLTGLLDADLVHRFESQGAHTVRGTAALRDLDVRVAGLDDPALAWRKLAVDVAGIDFVAQHADVTAVTLDGAHVVTRPAGPEPLPVLRGLLTAAARKAEALASPAAVATPLPPAATGADMASPAAPADAPAAATPTPPQIAATTTLAPPVANVTALASGRAAATTPAPAAPSSEAKPTASVDSSAAPTAAATREPGAAEADPTRDSSASTASPTGPVASAAPAVAPAAPAAGAPPSATVTSAGGAKPWTWTIGKIRLNDGHVQAIGGDGPVGIRVDAEAAPLTSTAGKPSAVRLALAPSSGGTIELTGNLVPAPLGFDGKLVVKDLEVAPLSQPVATAATRLVKNGVVNLDLAITAGNTAGAPPDGVRVAGTLDLADVDVAGEDPAAFAVRWKRLAVGITGITAPGVLGTGHGTRPRRTDDAVAAGEGNADGTLLPVSSGSIDVGFGALTLTEPDLTLTRTADGIALPAALGGGGSAPGASPASSPAAGRITPAPRSPTPVATPAAVAGTSAPSAPPAVRVQADRVTIERMRVTTNDTTVQPFFRSTLDPVELGASAVGWPGPFAKDVKLVAKSADGGVLTLTGDVAPERTRITVKLADLPLAPFNPYAASSGYGVTGGTARVDATIAVTGKAYETRSRLVLHELGVTSGEGDALFLSKFGMPLELALSLLTDLQGNIVLDLPVAGDAAGMRTDVGTLVANALTRAILNAVTSPLKLIGAVARIGEKPAALAPQPLVFLAGRATLADGEAAKLAPLAGLLARAPGLRVHLRAEVGETDRRWLREQALRAKLEAESGLLGSVRHIAERGARKAVLAALTARAEGAPGDIPAEHQEWFETAVAAQTVADDALAALADARIAEVRAKLASGQGVDAARIVVDEARLGDPAARPAVAVGLGAPAAATQPAGAAGAASPAGPAPSPIPSARPPAPKQRAPRRRP